MEENEKSTEAPASAGVQPQANSVIERANSAAERTEKAVEELRKENDRREQLLAEQKLGGVTEVSHEPTAKMTPKQYTEAVMRGETPDKSQLQK